MSEANPFQAPLEAEDVATEGDPSRPKPWSVLSLLATAVVLVFVGASWVFVRDRDDWDNLPREWSYFYQTMGTNFLFLQAILLGFWLGAGSGRVLFRCLFAALLCAGFLWVSIEMLGQFDWEIAARIVALVATAIALVDMALLSVSKRRTARRLAGSSVKIGLPLLAYGCIYHWFIIDPEFYYYVTDRIFPMGNIVGLALCGTIGGMGLLFLKHGLSRWYYRGWNAMLVAAPFLVSLCLQPFQRQYAPVMPWFVLLAYTLASLILLHSLHRVLRSYGASLVRVSWPEEIEHEPASEWPT